MSDERSLDFEILQTGVPNLDVVLGGGLPSGSFNLVAGGPGSGKTILSHQLMFHVATPDRQALHFTVLGEPVAKLLRYQSRFSFFDPAKVGMAIRYVDIGDVIRKEGLERGLEVIVSWVERHDPALVIIDSVRAVSEIARREAEYGLRTFTHDLSQVAVVWNTTTLMIGEFEERETWAGPEFTMADGILWMEVASAENSAVRKLRIVKSRGMHHLEGRHSFRIQRDGIYVYPRDVPPSAKVVPGRGEQRAGWNLPALDRMLEGGIPSGDSCLVAGPSGTGKSIFCQQWVAAGLERGETCVVVTFEETTEEYVSRAELLGFPYRRWIDEGKLKMVYYRPLDLSVDQVIDETRRIVTETRSSRLVVDSISGFEVARAPADKSSFREALYRMVSWFRIEGVTVLMSTEVPDVFGDLRLTTQDVSFVADNIILLRFIELESELRRVVAVIKMRRSAHDRQLRQLQITSKGIAVGAPFREYAGILSGAPSLVAIMGPQPFAPGLEARETALVGALFGLGSATADEIARESAFDRAEVDRLLSDLVGRGYIVRDEIDGQSTYHVAMVSWQPGIRRPPRASSGDQGGGNLVDH